MLVKCVAAWMNESVVSVLSCLFVCLCVAVVVAIVAVVVVVLVVLVLLRLFSLSYICLWYSCAYWCLQYGKDGLLGPNGPNATILEY